MNVNYRGLIFLYKYYKALLLSWIVITCAVYILISKTVPALYNFPLFIFLYMFAVILIYYFAVFFNIKVFTNRIHKILFIDCDPECYITVYETVNSELEKMKRPPKLIYFYINLSAGLIAAGKYNDAVEVLDKCKLSTNDRFGKLANVVYYNNLLSVYLKLGKVKEAENILEYFKNSMALLRYSDQRKYKKHLEITRHQVNLAQGIYDNAEMFFTEAFETSKNEYERVNAKFTLSKVYLHSGDAARASEALEYVIAHGNKLYIVEEAKERLAQIE